MTIARRTPKAEVESCAAGGPSKAPEATAAQLALAAAFVKQARPHDAASAYRAATLQDPNSAAAHLGLAAALLQLNQPHAALQSADRALALDGGMVLGWLTFGLALRAVGELAFAALALERTIELGPDHAAAHAQLGRIYDELDRPQLAERSFLRAVELDPFDKQSLVNLSALYGRADQYQLAREHAFRALKLDPNLIGAHQNLASIFAQEGREAESKRHRDLAYSVCNLFVLTTPRPIRRVLTLASTVCGNTPDRHILPSNRYDRLLWFVEYASDAQINTPPSYDVVFNAIGDQDWAGPAAGKVEKFLSTCSRPVLNHPAKIARTCRNVARSLFGGIEHLVTPETVRISAQDVAIEGAVAAARRAGVAAPLLIRPIGSHGGAGLKLLTTLDDPAIIAEAIVPDRDHYLTAFHDFRSADGLYRKYRMFFVDRRPYPYHLAIGPDWLVHYG